MFKYLTAGVATLASGALAQTSNSTSTSNSTTDSSTGSITDVVDYDDRAGLSCYFWSNWALYDLSTLTKNVTDYNRGDANWNYCKFAKLPAGNQYGVNDTFAYLRPVLNGLSTALPMTGADIVFDDVEGVTNETTGIKSVSYS